MKSSYLFILLSLTTLSCTFYKTIKNGQPGIDDNQKFPADNLTASANPYYFPVSNSAVKIDPSKFSNPGSGSFENYLKQRNTVAMVIIRNDTLIYENYFDGVDKDSAVLSFSVSKSFTSALVGSAISDGLIKSINDPITDYLPEMRRNNFDKVTIKHLLQMTSGIKFREDQGGGL